MPSLLIYLLNICAKGIINQFINECGANPKAADPVGVVAAHIFSNPDFQWRGKSLIDILMAKFRVVCPALFGLRGNDRTERGRLALGWKKEGPAWVSSIWNCVSVGRALSLDGAWIEQGHGVLSLQHPIDWLIMEAHSILAEA